ncbi:hypothetical protein [Caballeronia sp. BR00000012568055]|jgi:hypothetical protein|uniref:hypothetical protein n=1 Tax=Caballeronia sp. BR00000012568055 TaxID=2918761 RepID=UPI0023F98BFB|nr:hypothetical protein [Caballeronia sp. BR00000012568055]
MASSFRSLAASAVVLVSALVVGPAQSLAHSGNAELPVTLTIYDICTLDTNTARPSVACSAGGQYRVLAGEFFASVRVARFRANADRAGSIVEIAF